MSEGKDNNNDESLKEIVKVLIIPKNSILTVVLVVIFTYVIINSLPLIIFFCLIFFPFHLINSKINPKKYEAKNIPEKELRFVINTALVGSIIISLLIFIFNFINK